ncbi:MAG: 1-acyl-sn-glycerol-3-phosphate acyltransferase [Elusimicrobia bacterium]|nr:1-acyl-sn-glycerol-3-phosphate acyltransferase [Elusimicrobiota bacterium]
MSKKIGNFADVRGQDWFYFLSKTAIWFLGKIFFRLEIIGDIPYGGAILCSNHISNWDPPMIAASTNKIINFMAKKELFANPALSFLLRNLYVFPVDRKVFARAAFRKAVEIVNSGRNLLVFPEGTRNRKDPTRLGEIKKGVTIIIHGTNRPVIPVAVKGTDRWNSLARFRVIFGQPLEIPERKLKFSREVAEKIAERIKNAIQKIAGSHSSSMLYEKIVE